MKTKVSNELMAALRPGAAADKWPRSGPKARLPAFGMTAKEARDAAQRLGGLLPTKEQWDKAAGFSQRAGRGGPSPPGARVAVGLTDEGPLPVDASEDVSPLGVRDTAGNGTEFTRDLLDVKRGPTDPPPFDRLVILRGRRFTALKPMLYADLEEQQKTPQVQYEGKGSPYTGFRVVIEPPGG
jgi:formylglycine-generating enzyme required for sulfatase activity